MQGCERGSKQASKHAFPFKLPYSRAFLSLVGISRLVDCSSVCLAARRSDGLFLGKKVLQFFHSDICGKRILLMISVWGTLRYKTVLPCRIENLAIHSELQVNCESDTYPSPSRAVELSNMLVWKPTSHGIQGRRTLRILQPHAGSNFMTPDHERSTRLVCLLLQSIPATAVWNFFSRWEAFISAAEGYGKKNIPDRALRWNFHQLWRT